VRLVPPSRIGSVNTPIDATDAANKDYVDQVLTSSGSPIIIFSQLSGRPQKVGEREVNFGTVLATPPRAVLADWTTSRQSGKLAITGCPTTTTITLRDPRCNYRVVGKLPGYFRHDVSYMEIVALSEPTHAGVLVATIHGHLLWYIWISQPGLFSDSVTIVDDIEPTQRLAALVLADQSNRILVAAGDKNRVRIYRSLDTMGTVWEDVYVIQQGWCTNFVRLVDGRPAIGVSAQSTGNAKFCVCADATGGVNWITTNLPDSTGVVTNVFSLALIGNYPAIVRTAPNLTSPGVYSYSTSTIGATGSWSNVTPHNQFIGDCCSAPMVAYGVPWVAVSGNLGVFRGTTATGIGAPWALVRACAPGLHTFGPISATVQPDGVLTLGTGSLNDRFYSVWTVNTDTVAFEELTSNTGMQWYAFAAGGGCLIENRTLLVFVLIGMYFLLVYHVENTHHQIVIFP
jgi:hypothetical protein